MNEDYIAALLTFNFEQNMRKFTLLFIFSILLPQLAAAQDAPDCADVVKKSRKTRVIDREIETNTFMPKGQRFFGFTASFQSLNTQDFDYLIIDNFTAKAYTMAVSVQGGYVWKNDIAAGLQFKYSRTKVDIPLVDIGLGEDLQMSINDFSSIQHIFTGTAFLRTYIGLGKSKRFALFNDIKLSIGGGDGRALDGTGEKVKGSYHKIFRAGLVFQPGITIFINDFVAAEASLPLFGVRYNQVKQTKNRVEESTLRTWDTSFKSNLLAINFGVSFFF